MSHPPARGAAVALGAALVAGLAACAPQPESSGVTTLRSSALIYQIAANWNPMTSGYLNLFFAPQQTVYEPLIGLDTSAYEYEPVLAESYEVADDLRSMRIELREDVDFTDGTHLDAATIESYFAAMADSTTHAYFFDQYSLEAEATGEYELMLRSPLPMDNDFFWGLALVPIVSPTAMEDDPDGLEKAPVGTGPYILEEQIPEVSVTFVRNPDYRDPAAYDFEEVEFVVFADDIAASNALKSGQIDLAILEPSLAVDAENDGFAIHVGGGYNYSLAWTDYEGTVVPQLADARVRQAIAYAIDRESITEAVNRGYGSVNTQSWGPGSPYYVEGEDDRYAYDLERARELMADAGYESGFAMAMPSVGPFSAYDPALIQAFADIGITLTFDSYPDVSSWAEATAQYAMTLSQQSDVFTSARGFPQLADLYETIDTGTAEEAAAAKQEIGRIVLDDALMISVSRPLHTWVSIPEITMEVGIVTGWPPTFENYRLAG